MCSFRQRHDQDVLKVTQKQSGQRDLGILDKVKKEDGKIIPSTKMKKMMELLLAIREKGEKTIVFSQFTTCLDIVRRDPLAYTSSFSS